MASVILVQCDSYLDYLKAGVKHDTLAALRNSPLCMTSLFPDNVIMKAEEEISHHDDKPLSDSSHKKSIWYHPQSAKQALNTSWKSGQPVWSEQKRSGQWLQLLTATSQE